MRKSSWYRACAGAMILAGTCSFAVQKARAVVVFSDDFDRDDNLVSTTGPITGHSSVNWNGEIGALTAFGRSGAVGIQGNRMVAVTGDTPSYFQAGYATSNFASSWNNILTENTGKIVWTFNMQSSLANLPVFSATESAYTSVVLASTTNNPTTSRGYAVAWGNPGRKDQLRLTSFAPDGGVPKSDSFIYSGESQTDGDPFDNIDTEHLSIRVEYDPSTDVWSLFARDDGASFDDPALGSDFILIGSLGNTDHVDVPMTQVGFAGVYAGADFAYTYDNFTISVVPEPSAFLLGSLGLVGIAAARRRFGKKVG